MCLGTVAIDPVRNISLLFHVTQLWPMAFAHFQPAPRCCGTDFPFGFVRQWPSLSSRVSWRRICLRSRTCSIGDSNFFIAHGHSVLVHFVCFTLDVRSVRSRQSMLLSVFPSIPGSPCCFWCDGLQLSCRSIAFLLLSVIYPVLSLLSCIWYVSCSFCIYYVFLNLYLRLYIMHFIFVFLICN